MMCKIKEKCLYGLVVTSTLTKVMSAGSNTIEEGFKIHCRQTVSESCTQEKCGSGGEKPYQADLPWKGEI